MVKRGQIYKCNVCGNIVEIMFAGGGQLVCCGKEMELLTEKQGDQGLEKHVPVVEKTEKGIIVKVGSIPHPMEDSHFINWIEIETKTKRHIKFLSPGEKPEAEFCVCPDCVVSVREYCNVHGLWKK